MSANKGGVQQFREELVQRLAAVPSLRVHGASWSDEQLDRYALAFGVTKQVLREAIEASQMLAANGEVVRSQSVNVMLPRPLEAGLVEIGKSLSMKTSSRVLRSLMHAAMQTGLEPPRYVRGENEGPGLSITLIGSTGLLAAINARSLVQRESVPGYVRSWVKAVVQGSFRERIRIVDVPTARDTFPRAEHYVMPAMHILQAMTPPPHVPPKLVG